MIDHDVISTLSGTIGNRFWRADHDKNRGYIEDMGVGEYFK